MRHLFAAYLAFGLFCLFSVGPSGLQAREEGPVFNLTPAPDDWPTDGWKISTPEKQGVHSAVLARMFAEINAENQYITSVLIVRNGYVIAEANRNRVDHRYPIWSTTKSVCSALIGMALDRGIIESLDQPVYGFFPKADGDEIDPRKKAMRLYHLLSMSAGFDWPETETSLAYAGNPEYQMEMSPDWVEYVLNRPMARRPGETFTYNSGGFILLTAVMEQAGIDVGAFAQRHLFTPLGIAKTRYVWSQTSDGMPNGSHGLVMCSRDLAKIGYLYLKGGLWDGERILPKAWVEASTKRQIQMTWNGFVGDSYGYGWFVQPFGFHSLGYKGQYLFVLPAIETVVVFTSELALHELELPITWVRRDIIPAAGSTKPLPDDSVDLMALRDEIQRFNATPFW